jgi:NarL family two-component system sensor histidine kinase LiaS
MDKEIFIYDNKDKIIKIMGAYRYLSWALTSFFYCWAWPSVDISLKAGIVVVLFLEAALVNTLYFRCIEKTLCLRNLVVVETIGIALLLVPTGGVDSPFLWYALNPIFIATGFLKIFHPWLLFALYFVSIMWEAIVFEQHLSFLAMFSEHYQLIIVFILVILAGQLIVRLIKNVGEQADALREQSEQLGEANQNLQIANKKIQQAMNLMLSLYQAIEAFHNQDEEKALAQTFADYAARLTETRLAFFWHKGVEAEDEGYLILHSTEDKVRKKELADFLQKAEPLFDEQKNPQRITLKNKDLLVAVIKTPVGNYGLIGIEITSTISEEIFAFLKQILLFLVELYTIVLERLKLTEVNEKLLVAEEQNRIANEIHDSVNQRIYSMVCALYTLKEKSRRQNNEELAVMLGTLEETAVATLKELRSSVYGYSLQKDGEKVFFISIRKYLESVSYLNKIKVTTTFIGEEERLSPALKKVIYRIICEAAGNALRHGHCTKLEVVLAIGGAEVNLLIKDNGQGFDVGLLQDEKKRGLGIHNMQFLVQKEQGTFQINSSAKQGTEVKIEFPLKTIYDKEA